MGSVRAGVMAAPHAPVEIREVPEPELEPGSALLEVECSEVCGTDVHLRDGRLAGVPYPIIPGHVSVGRLEKIRGRLADVHGRPFTEGERVTFLDVHRTCHACWYCLVAKASTRCPERKVYGITYGLEDGLTGGWATKLHLKPGTCCIRLEEVPAATFMAGGCALPTALHAVERAGIAIGDSVLVLGSGPVGLSVIILAAMRGAGRILCIGGPANRLQSATDVGATDTLDFQSRDATEQQEWVRERTDGRGADLAIEATGDPGAVTQAMRCARDAGRVVVVGQYTDRGETTFNPHLDLNRKHLDVRGCWGSDFSHFHLGSRIMLDPDRRAPWERIALQPYGLDRLNEALADVADGRVVKALVDPRL
ncbi:MAG: zinc-binding dehydrogenase [Candidatus Krumholzibacteriia bacterium]